MSTQYYEQLKRMLDISCASFGLMTLALPMAGIALAVKLTSKGPAIHWSRRIGRQNREFLMPKFRTMRVDTPQLATHLVANPERYVTHVGAILRHTSLDELPQLFSILKGDMSVVGPRPALYNQADLISLRSELGIQELRPGLTGWAQVNGRDDLPIATKVELDDYYRKHRSIVLDMRILLRTVKKAVTADGVRH